MVLGCPGGLTAAAAVGFGVAFPFGVALLAPWSALLCWWGWRLRAPHGHDDPDVDSDSDGGGGGGGGRDDPSGGPGDLPTGGVDWDQFEREFRAYAERRQLLEV